ncbi:hypothetical protein [Streptomyces sp. NBC_01198]|uniref:hypothetical protein n=1 Tax=Streptomyces sp. NBC_01198 TaxID=2903769 RepID=UPI002E15352D|nr:hypothetical protein OG702_22055 [Streptomyces sp. NBC_01198]
MGVESDRLVFDYLSRVGDLAQTALPAAQRMQLVAQLRNDIDRERRGADSAAAVRQILGRIGSPDDVVEAAATTPGSRREAAPPVEEPPPGSYGPYAKARGPQVPKPGRPDDGDQGRGRDDNGREWWQGDGRGGRPRPGDELAGLPGMTGGVFIPFDDEELTPEGLSGKPGAPAAPEDADAADDAETGEPATAPRRRRLLRRGPRPEGVPRNWGSPVLLLAAALLVVGAAIGSLIPLGLGWLVAYLSRRLSRPQAKFAVLVIPGAFAAGMVVWIWGRDVGKWGTPIAQGQMGPAFQDAYPPVVRLAAVGTALYLLWRNRRSA